MDSILRNRHVTQRPLGHSIIRNESPVCTNNTITKFRYLELETKYQSSPSKRKTRMTTYNNVIEVRT